MFERHAAIALIWLVPIAALANTPAPPRPEVVWPGPQVIHEAREPKERCRVWLPELTAQASVTWSGACVEGPAQGPGILFLQHSPSKWDRYDGALLNGRPDGHGVLELDGTPGTRQLEAARRYEGTSQNGCYWDSNKQAWASWGPERMGWGDACL